MAVFEIEKSHFRTPTKRGSKKDTQNRKDETQHRNLGVERQPEARCSGSSPTE